MVKTEVILIKKNAYVISKIIQYDHDNEEISFKLSWLLDYFVLKFNRELDPSYYNMEVITIIVEDVYWEDISSLNCKEYR